MELLASLMWNRGTVVLVVRLAAMSRLLAIRLFVNLPLRGCYCLVGSVIGIARSLRSCGTVAARPLNDLGPFVIRYCAAFGQRYLGTRRAVGPRRVRP
ncbi:hypothetical protein ACFL6U_04155 [Planctomycetota bacterium]